MFWVSSGKIEINPIGSVFIGCGPKDAVESEKILDSLEANIIIVRSEDGASQVVIISVDSLFLGKDVTDRIISGLSGKFKQEEIFLAASHTHSAPMIDETKPRLGIRSENYATMLVDRIIEEVLRVAAGEAEAVKLKKYSATLGGIVERRNTRPFELSRFGLRWRPTLQRPNLRKNAFGADATIAEFHSEGGDVRAVLAVVPCHPVALMGRELISADYVGGLRAEFREKICHNQKTPFVFLQGASGDLNPWWKPKWFDEGPLKIIDQIVNGIRFSSPAFSVDDLASWCKTRIEELTHDRENWPGGHGMTVDNPILKSALHRLPLAEFVMDAYDLKTREVCFQWLQIGDLKLLGVSAEITSKLKQELKNLIGDAELVGCIRDSFGYATSTKQYLEGGYEAEEHQWYFSISHFRKDPPGPLIQRTIEKINKNSSEFR